MSGYAIKLLVSYAYPGLPSQLFFLRFSTAAKKAMKGGLGTRLQIIVFFTIVQSCMYLHAVLIPDMKTIHDTLYQDRT